MQPIDSVLVTISSCVSKEWKNKHDVEFKTNSKLRSYEKALDNVKS